jgi:hypothetical protein
VKSPSPRLARCLAFRTCEEVLEWHVQKGAARLGDHFALEAKIAIDVDAPASAFGHPGGNCELAVDEHGPAVAHEDPRGHAREAVPCSEEPARLVECGADKTAVDDPGCGLVALAEGKRRLVALDPLVGREREMDAVRVVAATPTRRVVVRRNAVQRRPPRSK